MPDFIVVTVLKPFDKYTSGQVVRVAVDSDGIALEVAWRRRIKDAEIDECCSVESHSPATRATKRRDQ